MFKKILIFIVTVITISLIVACEEITDDFEKAQKPSIKLLNEGELLQIYDENVALEDVLFTLELKQFEENFIEKEDIRIHWYVREQLMTEADNEMSYLQIVNAPGEITIRVEVIFEFEGKSQKLEENALINVMKVPTSILVTNSIDTTTHKISVVLGSLSEVNFTGRITGNLNHEIIKWVIQKQTTSEPVLVEEIAADVTVDGTAGVAILTYRFESAGNYIITLQTGEGTGQDANKYVSNSTHVSVGYGVFELSTEDSRIQSDSQAITKRTLYVSLLDEALVGSGSYEWYLNGEKLNYSGHSYEHENMDLGGYLYEVVFVPSAGGPELKTTPLLLVNGFEVETETELLDALDAKKPGIILKNDIEYSNESNSLVLDYPVTIYGDGHTLSSKEISVFMSVISDHVYLSDLKIVRANRYNLMFTNVNNIYLEDIVLEELGGGSDAGAFLSGDFGSGIYINKSEVVIHNVEFISGGLVGIRIDNDLGEAGNLAKL